MDVIKTEISDAGSAFVRVFAIFEEFIPAKYMTDLHKD